MSTYWSFVCLSHTPPLFSDEEFTQHTNDTAFKHALELASQRPVARYVDGQDYFEGNARRFLAGHPECPLAIESEYGIRYALPLTEENRP